MINWTKDIVDCSGEARLVSGKYRRNSIAAGETHNEHYYDSYDSYEGRQNRTEGQTVSAIMSQLIKLMSIFGVYICVRKFERFLK